MDGVDPDTLLEWLQTGVGDERDIQMMALEQLCMLLLMSDNIDRCFESCPPRTFLPALCKIFLDETAPENVLEVTARAITYYLDVSNECTRRITQVDGAVKAICNRLAVAEMTDRISKDLAEQCVKLLEHICQRETSAVYDAGGLQCMLTLVRQHGQSVHKDTMHSAMSVVTRLCSKMEPLDAAMPECSANLGALLEHDDPKVSECALRCFAALTDRFIRKSMDPVEMARHGCLVDHLLNSLVPAGQLATVASTASLTVVAATGHLPNVGSSASILSGESTASAPPLGAQRPTSFTSIVISLLSNLCRGSSAVTEQVVSSPLLHPALKAVLTSKDERCVMDALRLCDLLVVLLCEGRHALPRSSACSTVAGRGEQTVGSFDRSHRHLIDAIRQRDTDAVIDAVESGEVDANFTDDVGQTLLNWSSAFGTVDMVTYLCDKGADVNKGQRSSSLHYAACFGRPDVVKILLKNGANPDLRDEEGKTALDKARERSEEGHQQVAAILESPSSFMQKDETEKPEKKAEGAEEVKVSEQVDYAVVRDLLEQLLPVLCDVFQRSLGSSVRRSNVSLIRKTIHHMEPESLWMLVSGYGNTEADDPPMVELGAPVCSTGQKLAESIVNVIVVVLDHEDDIEGHENVLQLMKSLFAKDVNFWLEQLIRVGVFEKVEAIASQPPTITKGGLVTTMVVDDSGLLSSTPLVAVMESTLVKGGEHAHGGEAEAGRKQAEKSAQREGSAASSLASSEGAANAGSTPSSTPTYQTSQIASDVGEKPSETAQAFPDERDRNMMLNVPVHVMEESEVSSSSSVVGMETTTPPPTVEVAGGGQPLQGSGGAPVEVDAATFAALRKSTAASSHRLGPGEGAVATSIPLAAAEDRYEIVQGKFYRWKDWRLIKSRDSLFIWCDAVAMEFSDGSNGWFRFMLDGQLSTMYSSGSPESGADSAETRGEFIDKLSKARNAVSPGSLLNTVFSMPSANKTIEVGNWILASPKVGELTVTNRDGNQQRMIIMEDLPGFIFESNRQTKHCFQAESTLGLDFVTGWAARGGGRRLRFRAEAQKAKLQELAKELWDNFLKEARSKPRDALVELQKASAAVKQICQSVSKGQLTAVNRDELTAALSCVHESMVNERLLSTFELSISGLVGALLALLDVVLEEFECDVAKVFKKIFGDSRSIAALVRKIVVILESVEKFPQYLYDTPGGSSFGLQLLSRRIKLKLEHNNPSSPSQRHILDRTGRTMKTEPLTTVKQLKNFILKMTAKQWYDRDRETFNFIKMIKEARKENRKISFVYSSDFDDQGIVYWMGTNGKTTGEWTNPAGVGVAHVTSSDGARQPYGRPQDILSRDVTAMNCHTSDDKNANFTIDLGIYVVPTAYTLRHARGYGRSALRNWMFQGSRTGRAWEVLMVHEDDSALNDPGSTATWPISSEGKGPYRYFRITQNGKNASDQTYYLSLSGFELYGHVVDAVVDGFKPFDEKFSNAAAGKSRTKKLSASSKDAAPKDGSAPSASDDSAQSAAEQTFSRLPGGLMNNRVVASGIVVPAEGPSATILRNRLYRYRRGARLLAGGGSTQNPVVTGSPPANTPVCGIGSRVTRGPDWGWDNQGGGTDGTVISVVESGWVDVQWDDKTMNSYRFGADGKFDIQVKPGEPPNTSLMSVRNRNRIISGRMGGHGHVVAPSSMPFRGYLTSAEVNAALSAARPLPPAPRNNPEYSTPVGFHTGRVRGPSLNGFPFSRFHQNSSGARPSSSAVVEIAGPSRDVKSGSAVAPPCSSTIAQKSMSTTNLFDGSEVEKRPSVASTNQAASAESLQHQTPSLENLLARSKIFDERIPEVVTDDAHASSPEPRAIGVGSSRTVDTDQESVSTNNNACLDTSVESIDGSVAAAKPSAQSGISLAACTIAGGSQPTLRVNSGGSFDESGKPCVMAERRDTRSSPRESIGRGEDALASDSTISSESRTVSIEEANAKNMANLSVSAPDLVVLRQRQQSTAASTTALDPATSSSRPDFDAVVVDVAVSQGSSAVEYDESVQLNSANEFSESVMDDAIRRYLMEDEHSEESIAAALAQMTHHVGGSAEHSADVTERLLDLTPSNGAYNEFLDAYAHILDSEESATQDVSPGVTSETGTMPTLSTLSTLSTMSTTEAGTMSTLSTMSNTSTVDTSDANLTSSTASSTTLPVARRSSQPGSIRSRFGGYADLLRSMMQQVIDSGGSINALELEEIEDDIYDDEMQDDGNEEDCDDDFANGISVEALAQAAAALRRQSSTGSTGSTTGDQKLNWKQLVMSEAGRLLGERNARSSSSAEQKASSGGGLNRVWDDEFVLKGQFPALIPAFDPRPGRTNVNQIQDVELPSGAGEVAPVCPPPTASSSAAASSLYGGFIQSLNEPDDSFPEPKLKLCLRGPNLANISNATVELNDDDTSMFYFLQKLVQSVEWGQKSERMRRIWEPTYTLVYEETTDSSEPQEEVSKGDVGLGQTNEVVQQALAVISNLKRLGQTVGGPQMSADMFISEKLTQKLMQELADPLVVAARALPSWCDTLVYEYPCLFSLETRTQYLHATAFGTSRAIVWLQTRRDQILEQSRGATSAAAVSNLASTRRDDHYPEYRVGRIKHERIKVPRSDDQLFAYACRVTKFHASRKALLEVEYIGEEGTGLGPTLEFYALVAAEFQRKSLAMWICDDLDREQLKLEGVELDLGEGVKPPGYYVRRSGGLFPAPLPRFSEESKRACELFHILGIFLAKVLQDGRLVDIPLSRSFLKLMVSSGVVDSKVPDLRSVLTLDDLEEVAPSQGRVMKALSRYVECRRAINSNPSLDAAAKLNRIKGLSLRLSGHYCRVEHLALTFAVNPPSSVFTYGEMELVPGGSNKEVTSSNVELFVEKYLDFFLNSGIADQVAAFHEGFDLVFPLRSLKLFAPDEVQTLLSGEQCPEWTREDIIKYTEPKLGYSKDSPGFLRFVDVLIGMSPMERKSFLQFTTGCSSLPPGGLANLHPRLTVVRKVDSGDGSYPSVNTCVHYLKLPDYSTTEIMRARLLTATNEKGFHLN